MLTSRLGGRLLVAAAPVLLAAELVRSDHSQSSYAAQLADVANARTPELTRRSALPSRRTSAHTRGDRTRTRHLRARLPADHSRQRPVRYRGDLDVGRPRDVRADALHPHPTELRTRNGGRRAHPNRKLLGIHDLPASLARAAPRPDRARTRPLASAPRALVARRGLAGRDSRVPRGSRETSSATSSRSAP